MISTLERLSGDEREQLRKARFPEWVVPMLATLTDRRFDDPGWIFERKLDGVRLLAFRHRGRVRLRSRNRNDEGVAYPEIVEALQARAEQDLVLDGEVVAFDGAVTSFSRLQGRMQIRDPDEARESGIPVYYYVFDLLHLAGYDTTRLPLRRRKVLLRNALDWEDPVRFTPHRNENGVSYWHEACGRGWEGIIAKDARSPYVHARSTRWLKFKCVHRQELVVGGFTEPEGRRVGFGALLLGFYEGDALLYAGKVGTGWNDAELEDLRSRLDLIEQETSPFSAPGEITDARVHWVTPRIVGEIGFTEWTTDGRLRHPRWIGERRDKDAKDVVKETPDGG